MSSEFVTRSASYPTVDDAGVVPNKTRNGFLSWYQTIVLAGAVGVIYSNLPIYAYVLQPSLLPKFFFFGLFLLIAPLFITNFRALGAYFLSPFVLWALVLVILNIIHLAGSSIDSSIGENSLNSSYMEPKNALILTRIQYIVFAIFLGFSAFVSDKNSYLRTFIILAVLLPSAIILDFINPGLLYPIGTDGAVLGRAAAMFINPTMAAEAVLLVFLFSCEATKAKYRMPLFILLGAGVLTTFTRSAMIAWVLLWPLLIAKRILPKSAIFVTAIVLGIFLLSLGTFENYLGNRQDFEGSFSNIQARLDFFSNAKLNDDSSQERAEVIRAGWDLFLQNPVFGAGAGATYFWSHRGSTHNQLLLMAAEYGILGIGLWVWMVILLWKGDFFQNKSLQLAIVFLFVFMSMFTHQMLDSASYWLATFALASVRKSGAPVPGTRMA
ncbi:O-antigen ligase family protein [Noviherbaspirillum sedimenti]|uniref:O-antigen ligase-related domain-containing protein n=1 Tax=Noviherbaspirillum sedimenti TaxID=2320865 RepID=A0A3A3FYK1_9BURK|nr:O-antigen ligase family protein [Noviherbaspirillum sedimenti]RJG01288.1 hypothetical protein D3878_06560 [Noviherbaspirillum sedimenti]